VQPLFRVTVWANVVAAPLLIPNEVTVGPGAYWVVSLTTVDCPAAFCTLKYTVLAPVPEETVNMGAGEYACQLAPLKLAGLVLARIAGAGVVEGHGC